MDRINIDQLRVKLDAYHSSLSQLSIRLRREFEDLDQTWHSLNACYDGLSAEEFQKAWSDTSDWFAHYIEQTAILANELQSRIEKLSHV